MLHDIPPTGPRFLGAFALNAQGDVASVWESAGEIRTLVSVRIGTGTLPMALDHESFSPWPISTIPQRTARIRTSRRCAKDATYTMTVSTTRRLAIALGVPVTRLLTCLNQIALTAT